MTKSDWVALPKGEIPVTSFSGYRNKEGYLLLEGFENPVIKAPKWKLLSPTGKLIATKGLEYPSKIFPTQWLNQIFINLQKDPERPKTYYKPSIKA